MSFFAQDTDEIGYIDLESSVDIQGTGWHYITATREGNTFKLYIDGNLDIFDDTQTVGDLDVVDNLTIGTPSLLRAYFNGSIDEVKFYDYYLSGNEIIAEYNSYFPHYHPLNDTLSDVGQGVGNLLLNMSPPLTILIIILAVVSMVGFIISSVGRRIGEKI